MYGVCVDAGHFALDEAVNDIAGTMRRFLVQVLRTKTQPPIGREQ
jgi:hypothetical protein